MKTREIHSTFFDSRVWNKFKFRDDDIVIGTYAKSGTTWVQQIIGQLLFDGQEGLPVAHMSPWLDFTIPTAAEKLSLLEAQTHRRFIKTHLPVDALVFSPRAKYVYVGRDGRDVVWSFHNHHVTFNNQAYQAINDREDPDGPPLVPTTKDVKQYFAEWLERNGYPWWPFWENIRSWWDVRHLPNVMLVHFETLKKDMPGEMRRMATFLDIPINESHWPKIVEHCSFNYMKEHADNAAPVGGIFWEGGGKTFVHKGTNGRWRDVLTAEESHGYEHRARVELGEACAHWLGTGEVPK